MLKQKRSVVIAIAVVLGAVCLSTHAQQPASTPRQQEPTTGSITGRVVNESGQPLANATVFIRPLNSITLGRTTISDAEGNFHANGLDSALYLVSATLPAYIFPPRDPDAPVTYFRIGDTVRLDLIRGGVVTGTVTNSAGEPVIGVRVRATLVRDATGKPTKGATYLRGESATDDRGIYRIYGLALGSHIVQAGGAGRIPFALTPYDFDVPTFAPSSNRDTATEIIVRSGEESTADIRYRGEQGHVVSGTVKLRGTTGANVTLTAVGDGVLPAASSYQYPGTHGFAFYGVADGDYEVVAQEVVSSPNTTSPDLAFSDPRRITVKSGDIAGIELTTMPLASISGRFTLETSKIPDCQGKRQPSFQESVVLLGRNEKDDSNKEQSLYLRLYASAAAPDKVGVFVLRNIRPGQYAFTPKFFARYWYIQSMTITSSPPTAKAVTTVAKTDATLDWTTIKGENINGLTINLAEGAASISGQISISAAEKLPPNSNVYLIPSEREKGDDVLRFFVTEAKADGSFTLSNLPPGHYWIMVQNPGEKDPKTTDKLRLPDANEARAKLRRVAESAKKEIELKPCQNLTDYRLPLK